MSSPLWYMLPTAMGLAEAEVVELHLAQTEVLCVAIHVCVCVCLCSVNYTHTYRSVANEPLNHCTSIYAIYIVIWDYGVL